MVSTRSMRRGTNAAPGGGRMRKKKLSQTIQDDIRQQEKLLDQQLKDWATTNPSVPLPDNAFLYQAGLGLSLEELKHQIHRHRTRQTRDFLPRDAKAEMRKGFFAKVKRKRCKSKKGGPTRSRKPKAPFYRKPKITVIENSPLHEFSKIKVGHHVVAAKRLIYVNEIIDPFTWGKVVKVERPVKIKGHVSGELLIKPGHFLSRDLRQTHTRVWARFNDSSEDVLIEKSSLTSPVLFYHLRKENAARRIMAGRAVDTPKPASTLTRPRSARPSPLSAKPSRPSSASSRKSRKRSRPSSK